jgi:uncharacterized protein YybS (DUF2232 family)
MGFSPFLFWYLSLVALSLLARYRTTALESDVELTFVALCRQCMQLLAACA